MIQASCILLIGQYHFLRRTLSNLGEHSTNRAEAQRTWAEVQRTRAEARRTRAEVRRTRAGNFRKRRRAKDLGEQWAKLLHPIPTSFMLRPIELQAFLVHSHMY